MVLSNLTTVWVIGGADELDYTRNDVNIFNSVTMKWTLGAFLLEPRYSPTCAMILKNNQSQSLTQIVIGGSNDYYVRLLSVEIFDDQTNSWVYGPDMIVYDGTFVNDGNNGLFLIGGMFDTFYRLRHAGSQWEKMEIKIKTPRYSPIAFYIPSNMTNCI